jgi:hypothetical protein
MNWAYINAITNLGMELQMTGTIHLSTRIPASFYEHLSAGQRAAIRRELAAEDLAVSNADMRKKKLKALARHYGVRPETIARAARVPATGRLIPLQQA